MKEGVDKGENKSREGTRVEYIESQQKTWGAPGSGPRTVLEVVHVHNVDAVFLELVEQICNAPIFAVTRVYGTLRHVKGRVKRSRIGGHPPEK